MESWADYKINLVTDIVDVNNVANSEHAIVTMNHPGDLDWMVGWTVINRIGMLGVRHRVHTYTYTYLQAKFKYTNTSMYHSC